jgi:protoporphyrinogen/coproporphyrinogen III oxidase
MVQHPVIIIGAGVSGLSAAVTLIRQGIQPLVLDANSHVGGVAHSFSREGYLCEAGPNTLLVSTPELEDFLTENNLLDSAVEAAPHAKKRFVVQNNQLVALPHSPFSLLTSPVLSSKGKLRLIRELWTAAGTKEKETLADFVERRFGTEVLQEFVDPFVSGIYSGDPKKLLVQTAFPKLWELEQKHGSLLRGMIQTRSRVRRRLLSWSGGFSEFSQKLASPLEKNLLLSQRVKSIEQSGSSFVVHTDHNTFETPKLIIATPAHSAATLAAPLVPEISKLSELPHASLATVHLGFPVAAVDHPLDGFGVLISRARKIRTLGCLFSSTLFPGRAPSGHILLTAFMGGVHDPQAAEEPYGKLVEMTLSDLRPLLGIRNLPVFTHVTRWRQAIPQYEESSYGLEALLQSWEAKVPGLHFLGSYRGGISLSDCLLNGHRLAKRL